MPKFKLFVTLVACLGLSSGAFGESYQLSTKTYNVAFPKGTWKGDLLFPDVYCATAPSPEKAERFTQAMYNNNTLYRVAIEYPEKTLLAVAFSSIPMGRSADEDVATILTMRRMMQDQVKNMPVVLEVSELSTSFGKTVGLRMNNVKSDTQDVGPFPLGMQMFVPPDGALFSMSVHRIFARGAVRFEVAAMQIAPQPQTSSTEAEMKDRLSTMVETLTDSLQKCTGALPVRMAN
jgi:hypothetical protein